MKSKEDKPQEGTQVPLPLQDLTDSEKRAIAHAMQESKGREAQYIKAIEFLDPLVDAFQTPEGEVYVGIKKNGVQFYYNVLSSDFRRFIISRFKEFEGKVLTKESVERVRSYFEAVAFDKNESHPVYKRVVYINGIIYYDLCNSKGEVIEITPLGWRTTVNPPVRFVRKKGMLSNVMPSQKGNLSLLRRYLRLDDKQWILLASAMLDYLYKAPYPILSIVGQQGSSKSTTSKVISKLIDPNETPINAKPRDERDLFIMAVNSHLLIFDNLSGVSHQTSDTFCRLATGGGFRTRQLYSDSDEKMIYSANPIIGNGIDSMGARGDLISRMIQIYLPTIPAKERLTEDEFWLEFDKDHPIILGGIFDALVIALKNLPLVDLPEKPRMADFAVFACAASEALAITPDDFMSIYFENIQESNKSSLELDPLAVALERLISTWADDKTEWIGTMTILLQKLAVLMSLSGRQYPKTPQALSNRLKRLAPMLYSIGIGFEQLDRESGTGNRLYRLFKISPVTQRESICDDSDNSDDASRTNYEQ